MHSYYGEQDSGQLIRLWEAYNRHLSGLEQRIPEQLLMKAVNTGEEAHRTIAFLIDDYVAHLEHHLREIVTY